MRRGGTSTALTIGKCNYFRTHTYLSCTPILAAKRKHLRTNWKGVLPDSHCSAPVAGASVPHKMHLGHVKGHHSSNTTFGRTGAGSIQLKILLDFFNAQTEWKVWLYSSQWRRRQIWWWFHLRWVSYLPLRWFLFAFSRSIFCVAFRYHSCLFIYCCGCSSYCYFF